MHFVKRYKDAGYSFFNTNCAEKKVATKWTEFQHRKPTDREINLWLDSHIQNYAIVCGEISGIIVFDVDPRNDGDPTPFLNRGFYEVRTPSGGYHFYMKYDPLLQSTKHKKQEHKGILKGVDVQSNGALVFAPPTKFKNGGYDLVNDAPLLPIPDDILTQVLEALEPEKEATDYKPFTPRINPEMGRPGDVFNALMSWGDVLIPLGWTRVGYSGDKQFWRRPGKTDGISASTNWNNYDLFFPYTTSIDGLVQHKGYTKFNLYATLQFNGDYKAAARALVLENYKLANKLS
ncbi:MAG TPA: bifunctional DNA primase/polymerase [Stenomitos sp.]